MDNTEISKEKKEHKWYVELIYQVIIKGFFVLVIVGAYFVARWFGWF